MKSEERLVESTISVDDLRIGHFIRLELSWFEHPFMFKKFKIKSEEQIETLKGLGLTSVIYIPSKSDVGSEGGEESQSEEEEETLDLTEVPEQESEPLTLEMLEPLEEKEPLQPSIAEKQKERRERARKCEGEFKKTVNHVRSAIKNVESNPRKAMKEADNMVGEVLEDLLTDPDTLVNLMNANDSSEGEYYHSVNVSLLSLILGREAGLEEAAMKMLGTGALFHDIGKTRIPNQIIQKTSGLTSAETKFLRDHPIYGEEIVSKLPDFPEEGIALVREHHEKVNGKGYPDGLSGSELSVFTKIVSIVNAYDNLCNARNPEDSLTPYQALSLMFGRQKEQYDNGLLSMFIRCLGVYPPGTIVQLSTASFGMVLSTNPHAALRPKIMLYDPEVHPDNAPIIDLEEEPDVKITLSLRPSELSPEIFDYLNPRARVTYFINPSPDKKPSRE